MEQPRGQRVLSGIVDDRERVGAALDDKRKMQPSQERFRGNPHLDPLARLHSPGWMRCCNSNHPWHL